jgi:hypothetical protein
MISWDLHQVNMGKSIVTSFMVVTNNNGFCIEWLDLLTPYTVTSYLQAMDRYRRFTQFTVHRYTRTRIPSLHKWYHGKLRGFSPQANYTDWAAVACRRSQCQLLRIESVALSAQRIPTAANLDFLDPELLLFPSRGSSLIPTRLSRILVTELKTVSSWINLLITH